jgi:hypothetical protein
MYRVLPHTWLQLATVQTHCFSATVVNNPGFRSACPSQHLHFEIFAPIALFVAKKSSACSAPAREPGFNTATVDIYQFTAGSEQLSFA